LTLQRGLSATADLRVIVITLMCCSGLSRRSHVGEEVNRKWRRRWRQRYPSW